MSTGFPTSLDNLDPTRGTTGQKLSTPNHITHHQNEDDAIEALQVKVGINNSADTSSLDYKLKNTASSNPGHKHTLAQGATDVTATSTELNYMGGVTSGVQSQLNTLSSSKTDKSTLTTKGDFYVATASATLTRLPVGSDNQVLTADSSQASGVKWASVSTKFGGTGADGALTVSSGTTSIDLGSAAVVVKNYTTISITGTGAINFINPHANGTIVIIKATGNITLTSSAAPMIDCSNTGAAGGAGTTSSGGTGTSGNNSNTFTYFRNLLGTGGQGSTTGGTGGAVPTAFTLPSTFHSIELLKYQSAFCGGGGGGGGATFSNGSAVAGTGGRGGGGLIIECAGAWNFTTASGISVSGQNGANGVYTPGSNGAAAGGGGGGGGFCLILYNALTANSGTVTSAGGTGGNTNGLNSNNPAGGGGGGSTFNAGSNGSNPATNSGKSGGDGGAGFSLVTANTIYT
ncbi:hypothetical protein [Dongia sp.]|uniref:hypothetical protein n=1 Tax=Dongia sp. TaxID=1977262 RepID=UPI00375140E8